MMKKKYIKPEMQVYEIGHQQMLAGSDLDSNLIDINIDDKPDDINGDML